MKNRNDSIAPVGCTRRLVRGWSAVPLEVKLAGVAIAISIAALIISGARILHVLGNSHESSETTRATIEIPMANQTDQ